MSTPKNIRFTYFFFEKNLKKKKKIGNISKISSKTHFFFTFSVTFRPDFRPSAVKSDLLTLVFEFSVENGAMTLKTMPHAVPWLRLDESERFFFHFDDNSLKTSIHSTTIFENEPKMAKLAHF